MYKNSVINNFHKLIVFHSVLLTIREFTKICGKLIFLTVSTLLLWITMLASVCVINFDGICWTFFVKLYV